MLRVSPNPIKFTPGFQRTQQYLRSLPRARTMEEIEKQAQGQQGGQSPTSNGRYERNVPYPSGSRSYRNSGLYVNVPENWREFPSQSEVWFAPEGAYGDNGITHGAIVGIQARQSGNFQQDFDNYVKGMMSAEGNSYLRAQSGYSNTTLNNRSGLVIALSGRSPVTGRTELVTIYGSQTDDRSLFYVITVVPQDEVRSYQSAFRNIIRSARFN